ncbi:hypothetical protein SDC9_198009 [bioreactor metagenome]|uniref:Uncharacterized protein n=1 Tax=bioreactor metagenome TaxID=1076179 RepID=A0A645ITA2_9ZZZZ
MGGFQRFAALNQNAEFRTLSGANHDGGRGSQPKRAGAGDDQHGHEDIEHKVEVLACERPDDGGEHGNADDGGHKVAGDHVRELRNGRFASLRLLDEMDDLRQRGVLANLGYGKA